MSDSSMLHSNCPLCGKGILIRPDQQGRRLRCPRCREKFTEQGSAQNLTSDHESAPETERSLSVQNDVSLEVSMMPADYADEIIPVLQPTRTWPQAKFIDRFPQANSLVFRAAVQILCVYKCELADFDVTNHAVRFSLPDGKERQSQHDLRVFDSFGGQSEIVILSRLPNEDGKFDVHYATIARELTKYLLLAQVASSSHHGTKGQIGYRQANTDRNYDDGGSNRDRNIRRRSGPGFLTILLFVLVGVPMLTCGGCVAIGFFGAAVVPHQGRKVPREDERLATTKENLAPTKPKQDQTSESRFPSVGDRVIITTEMLLGVDDASHTEALRLLRANDEIGLTQMEQQGRMFVVQSGTEGLLLEGGFLTKRVRILSGPHSGKAGYITSDFVKKK